MKLSIETLAKPGLSIHIIGAAATEGSAIARFLFAIGAKNVTLHDFCKKEDYPKQFLAFHNGVENRAALWQTMKALPYTVHFSDTYLEGVEKADILFLPQAWYKYDFNFPILGNIVKEKKVATTNLIDLYLQLFPGRTVGVTGTHGKTTVMRLIGHILKEAGKNVYVSGNDRHSAQVLELLAEPEALNSEDILVLEISNRHLKQALEKSPHIAVITNIYPNHLDEHDSIDEYREVKKSIAAKQGKDDYLILGPGDEKLRMWGEEKNAILAGKDIGKFKMPTSLPGAHNNVNALLAYEACKLLGINEKDFQIGLNNFPGVEKRLEKIYEDEKVIVINDLAATTPQATETAIHAFPDDQLIVIMGGDDKNLPESAWQQFMEVTKDVTLIVLPGTVRDRLKESSARFIGAETFADALEETKKLIQEKSLLLISPGGEGFYTKFLQGVNLKKTLTSLLQ